MHLKLNHVKDLIDEPYFSRGRGYFQDGMVQLTSLSDTLVKARVVGGRAYKVTLKFKNWELDGECTCSAFEDFGPCKHMAATGFAVMAQQQNGYSPSEQCINQANEYDEFEKFLQKKTKKDLIEIIIRLSDDYPEIIDELRDEE